MRKKKEENKEQNKEKKKGRDSRLQFNIAVLILAVLFIADLYVMINMPQNFLMIVSITVLSLIALFFAADAVSQEKNHSEEQYDNIFKSEKASYILLKKSFDELTQLMQQERGALKIYTDEIIHAQKTVAKVTIGRSKENTDALMNSNDRILEKINMLEAVISDGGQNQPVSTVAETHSDAHSQEILNQQKELLERLNELAEQIKENSESAALAAKNSAGVQKDVQELEMVIQKFEETTVFQMRELLAAQQKLSEEFALAEAERQLISTERPSAEVPVPETPLAEPEEELASEEIPFVEPQEELLSEDTPLAEPEEELLSEDTPLAEPEGELTSEDTPFVEPEEELTSEDTPFVEPEEELTSEDTPLVEPEETLVNEELPLADAEIVSTGEEFPPAEPEEAVADENLPVADAEVVSEGEERAEDPVVENLPDFDEMLQNILKNSDDDFPLEETKAEEEPPVEKIPLEDETVVDDRPPMPDLSDPNKVMTPEEIAALIANL